MGPRVLSTALLLVVLGSAAVRVRTSRTELEGHWDAGLHRYDYLERLELEPDGSGWLWWGWDQHVHYEEELAYRVPAPGQLELIYLGEGRGESPRRLAFRLAEGAFRFVQPGPIGETHIVCRRRLTFSKPPFPSFGPKTTEYYSACSVERPPRRG